MAAHMVYAKDRKTNLHTFGLQVDEFKRQLLLHAIELTGSNVAAAKYLGMNRQHFYKTFQRLGLELPTYRGIKQAATNKTNNKLLVNWRFNP